VKAKPRAQPGESRLGPRQSEPVQAKSPRPPFPCPICEVPVPAGSRTCANCGVKFDASQSIRDERDELGGATDQSMDEGQFGAASNLAGSSAKGPLRPVPKLVARPGLTNGLALGGRGPPRTGKTNGLQGRTNGSRGRTNGLRGRTNGLTNGLRGRTNGLTNGLGRTNGLTNGLGSGPQSATIRTPRRGGGMHAAGWKIYLIPLVSVALLLVPLFFIPVFFAPARPIQIDGQFGDWASVTMLDTVPSPGNANPDINMIRVAVKDNVEDLAFYIEVQGGALNGGPAPARTTNAFYAFIDVDRSRSTGYLVQGIGADRMIRINTWGGSIVGASLETFNTSRSPNDWNGWVVAGPVNAAGSGSRIEFETAWTDLAPTPTSVQVAFASRSWDGQSDAADVVATNADPLLLFSQDTSAPPVVTGTTASLARVTLRAADGPVEVRSINVTFPGTYAVSSISAVDLVDENGSVLSQRSAGPVVQFGLSSFVIPRGDVRTLTVRPTVSTADNSTIGAFVKNLEDVFVSSGGVAFIASVTSPASLAYIGSIPLGPRVDGGFADWKNASSDPTGDVQPVPDADVDLSAHAFQGYQGSAYFMAETVGTVLNGTLVPSLNSAFVPSSGNGSSSGTLAPPPPPVNGTDSARFFLDLDGTTSTGYQIGGIGADYLVQITGKGGEILSAEALRFAGSGPSNWTWSAVGATPAAKDRSRLEASLPGIAITNASRAFVQLVGWNGLRDDSGVGNPPLVVSALGLMYAPANGVDPTGITDTSTGSVATGGPHERNAFYDGTNFWAFYYDGSTIQYESSSDGLSWVNMKNPAFATTSVRKVSTWFYDAGGGTKIVYIVGDTGAGLAVHVRRGTINGTAITWGTDTSVTVANKPDARAPFITRDASGYIWIGTDNKEAVAGWNFAAIRSTNADDVSAWPGQYTDLLAANIGTSNVQGVLLPLASGDTYAIWYAAGTIGGKRYTASNSSWWTNGDAIATTSPAGLTKAPSATVDGSFNIHLVYVDSAGAVKYRQRTSSWGSVTTLDGSGGNTYPTISRDTGTSNLYALYISSTNQIMAQKYSGSWSAVTLETNTNAKSGLTSTESASSSSNIAWTWTQGTVSPWDVKFSVLSSSLMSRTIDTSTDSTPVSYNHQRKVFYDEAANYWAFYFDGSNAVYTYSADALTWENGVSQVFATSGVDNPSVWFYDGGATKIVYAVGDTGGNDNNLLARRGTISGGIITWGPEGTVPLGGSTNVPAKIGFISRDSNGNLWVASNCGAGPGTYNVCAVKSSNVDDVSSWGSVALLMGSAVSNNFVYPTILPLSSSNMYALWYADGTIGGKKYAATWGTEESINTTTAGVTSKIPSAVADGSDNIHLAYVNASGAVLYRERTSSWGAATVLDSTGGSTSPTITLSGNDLFVFWIAGTNQITGKGYTGSWNSISGIEASSIPKGFLTSPYSYSSASLAFLWGQGSSSPYEIKIAQIPEFQDAFLPISCVLAMVLWFARRRRIRHRGHPGE